MPSFDSSNPDAPHEQHGLLGNVLALSGEAARERLLLNSVIDHLPGAFFIMDGQNRLLRWNTVFEVAVGYPASELNAMNPLLTMFDRQRSDAIALVGTLRSGEASAKAELEVVNARGERTPYLFHLSRLVLGDEVLILGHARDISEHYQSAREIKLAKERLDLALDSSSLALWDWELTSNRVFFNENWARLLGDSDGQAATFDGVEVAQWTHPDDLAKYMRALSDAAKGDAARFICEYRVLHRNGNWIWVHSRGRVTERDSSGKSLRMLGTCMNITSRKETEERAHFLATRDPLTSLPNRVLLADRLEQGLAYAARHKTGMAFMFVDLDRFKNINDSLGHHVGDEMLKRVANRLAACVRATDTVARLGGDEFAVLLENIDGSGLDGSRAVAEKMIAALASPMVIDGHQLTISCSIGIGLYPEDGRDSSALMKNADVAMYHAKENGRNNFQFFSSEMNQRAQERLAMENYLRLALKRNELLLYYQPRLSLVTGEVTGAEALLRWKHPRHGLLAPGRFIQLAEEVGLIVPIGEWVIETACEQLKSWQVKMPHFKMAVNVSVGQLADGARLQTAVERSLAWAGVPASSLELELTESIFMTQVDERIRLMTGLANLGVSISIDDFGTGYSSLSYLKRLPVDSIKIDGSFVREIDTDANDRAIVQAILAMAFSLGKRTVAEGVETQAQLLTLQGMGCDEYQGYLCSRPIPPDQFEDLFL